MATLSKCDQGSSGSQCRSQNRLAPARIPYPRDRSEQLLQGPAKALSLDVGHYIPSWTVPRCLSLQSYTGCCRVLVTTLLHGQFQDTCQYTPTWVLAGHLSLDTSTDCPRTPVTLHLHRLSKMPATTHLCGLSHDACHYTSTSLSQDACHSTSAWVCHGRAPFWGSDAQTLNQPTC